MDATDGHRKIELQSPDDLTFLIQNARRVAEEHITQALPPIERDPNNLINGVDGQYDMRARIEEIIDEFITTIFTEAAANISINGMPITSITPYISRDPEAAAALADEDVYEPFDERKRQRLVDLAAEEEDLLRDIAGLKRRVPRDAAARFAESAWVGLGKDETILAAKVADAQRGTDAQQGRARQTPALGLADPTMAGRQDEVREQFVDAVGRLDRVKTDMAGVVARMQRAKTAAEYVVAKEK